MSDTGFIAFIVVAAFVTGFMFGGLVGDVTGRHSERERFLTFCPSQSIPYAKCKEEWEKP